LLFKFLRWSLSLSFSSGTSSLCTRRNIYFVFAISTQTATSCIYKTQMQLIILVIIFLHWL
jgi:hypothetical protein